MSAIRPSPPSVLFPPLPAGQAPARATRSDFFKAALDAARAGGTEAPARPDATPNGRPTRPGTLLDIRV